jgi:hypothetical protein
MISQKTAILEYMQRGHQITPASAYALCGSLRLSERIRELERDGYHIDRQRVTTGRTTVMGYRLRVDHV